MPPAKRVVGCPAFLGQQIVIAVPAQEAALDQLAADAANLRGVPFQMIADLVRMILAALPALCRMRADVECRM